ncbi:MAG: hypothetical protein AAF607_08975, partial [Pseudomonadota bacterium]
MPDPAKFHEWPRGCAALISAFLLCLSAAYAQDPTTDTETIIVRARGLSQQSLSPLQPEVSLNENDIAAYGLSTVAELIEALSPQTSSARGRSSGRPFVLVNGERTANFREFARYPTEAIERVDILPEEVALSYGFPASARVVNIILKRSVTLAAIESELRVSGEGGTNELVGSAQYVVIDGSTRTSLDGAARRRTPLFEAERDIDFAGQDNDAAFRTLLSRQRQWELGGSIARPLFADVKGSLSAAFERVIDDDERGEDLTAPGTPLTQRAQTDTADIGLTLSRRDGATLMTLTTSANRVETDTTTALNSQTNNPVRFARDTTLQRTTFSSDFSINSEAIQLPAGPLSLTAQLGFNTVEQRTRTAQLNMTTQAELARDTVSGQLSATAPLRLARETLPPLYINANIDLVDLSDIGTLITYGYGLYWEPRTGLSINISTTRERGAPSLNELGGPIVITHAQRVFDFTANQNVFVETVTGGNPGLIADRRRVIKLALQFDPKQRGPWRFNVDYTRARISDETRTFTLLTPQFEAAFPNRIVRDGAGVLVSFDRRPVLTAQTERDELKTTINWVKRYRGSGFSQLLSGGKPGRKQAKSGQPQQTGGSLRMTLTHRLVLRDRVRIAPGVEPFDFLSGAAATALGGTPQHRLNASLRRWRNGLGLSASLGYQSGTEIINATETLSFSSLVTSALRISYNLSRRPNLI